MPADDAFQPSLHLRDGDRAGLVIRYRIAEGYYLYRDRIRIETVPRGAPVGPPEFPEARSIEDAFLGKSWIYRESVEIALPFTGSVADPARIRVRVTAQGCAEDRLCYAPFTQEIRLRDDTQAGGSAP